VAQYNFTPIPQAQYAAAPTIVAADFLSLPSDSSFNSFPQSSYSSSVQKEIKTNSTLDEMSYSVIKEKNPVPPPALDGIDMLLLVAQIDDIRGKGSNTS
jgi:hypothetical protein